jgi:hypothetical protein
VQLPVIHSTQESSSSTAAAAAVASFEIVFNHCHLLESPSKKEEDGRTVRVLHGGCN